jgi:CheY-like chemotaxis protein
MGLSRTRGIAHSASDRHAPVRTIRMTEEQINKILERLDRLSAPSPERRSRRYPFRPKALIVRMRQPGATQTSAYQVIGRNISGGGISFLDGGFVHNGSRCTMQLMTPHGSWSDVAGTVIRCRYVESNVHEVAVLFDHAIDPAQYCPEAIRRRFLLVEDDPSAARLASFHLEQLHVKVESVSSGKIALQRTSEDMYDVVLLDMDMPEMTGFEVAEALRKRGYGGMIVAVTGLTQEGDRERCLAAGCDRYLPKPCTRDSLSELVCSLHKEPLFSTFHDDPSMTDLIREFVAELPKRIRSVEAGIAQKDIAALVQVFRALKSDGAGYGFGIISDTAAGLESTLLATSELAKIDAAVHELVKFCLQAQAPAVASPTAPTG